MYGTPLRPPFAGVARRRDGLAIRSGVMTRNDVMAAPERGASSRVITRNDSIDNGVVVEDLGMGEYTTNLP